MSESPVEMGRSIVDGHWYMTLADRGREREAVGVAGLVRPRRLPRVRLGLEARRPALD